jgi:prophage antirepressor-like protein
MELQIFESERFGQLRTYRDGKGTLWFCAKDIANALGYSTPKNTTNIFGHVPDEWRCLNPINTCNGIKQMLCLSEPGLYFFLGRSDKPKALNYQKWVAGEVIPAIRQTGEYKLPGLAATKTAEELVNARLQVVTLRIMGSLSIYTPTLRMRFLAEAASLMSGKPMSEYLPPVEEGNTSDQWMTASGLARHYGVSDGQIGRIMKKRGLHGSQDETHEWSHPICYPGRDGLCRILGYLYNHEILGPRLERAMEGNQEESLCC